MTRTLLLLFVMFLGQGVVAQGDDKLIAPGCSLEGDWKLTSVELNGQPLPMEKLRDAELVVQGTKYTLTLLETRLEMTHKLMVDQMPAAMDLTVATGPQKGQVFRAIFKLEGETLTVCRSIYPEMERPKEFASKPDSGLLLVVWTRSKSK
jgi:uncharacterized protein (TIGR03067 family)